MAAKLQPHLYRELVNELRDVARLYHDKGQLREKISSTIGKYIKPEVTMKSNNGARCLVVKGDGDFDKALHKGYAINNYCAEGFMWLSIPPQPDSISSLKYMLEKDGFIMVSEPEER